MRFATISLKGLVGSLVSVVGGLHPMVTAFGLLMPLDVILGWMAGFKRKKLSSDKCFKGLVKKKMAMIFLLAAGQILDKQWGTEVSLFGTQVGLTVAIAGGFVVHEVTSLIENAALLGAPVPRVLVEALEKLSGGKEKIAA